MEIFKPLGGDGAHCGISDLYKNYEQVLVAALASGQPFDTGWFSSKKEIVTGRVYSDGQTVTCEVYCSDDFDTEGKGETEASSATLDDVVRALDEAWDKAEKDRTENEPYQGFKVLRRTRQWSVYIGGKPVGKSHISLAWVETLILPKGDGCMMDFPPGDNYREWGWQNDGRQMPRKVRAVLRTWAENWMEGKKVGGKRTCEGWTIQPWKD
jgi:hypothetical protein